MDNVSSLPSAPGCGRAHASSGEVSSLVLGTTMAPGYVDGDYIPGDRELLVEQYPDRAELITSLTR